MAEQDLAAIARTIIHANRYMTLATADAQGQPWASPVFYATADYTEFYWISAPQTTHSTNLAQRPQISIVIFDSRAPEGTGQAVYLSATAGQVPDHDLDQGLAVYPGPAERGPASRYTREQLQAPAPYRLYQATVFGHSILCPRDNGPRGTEACTLHGLAFDHRTQVRVAG
jgi:pyridoxamine 5'-phosphate oxidase-like protein